MKNIMVDLETLSNVPGGVILSIGAVGFDENGADGPQFYAVINKQSCINHGMHVKKDTVEWWGRQSAEARQVLDEACQPHTPGISHVLEAFSMWVRGNFDADKVQMWSNGADFDLPFLQIAYHLTMPGIEPPWKFRNNRCYRTLKNKVGRTHTMPNLPELTGTAHNALDDAVYQAQCAVILLRQLDLGESCYETATLAAARPNQTFHNTRLGASMAAPSTAPEDAINALEQAAGNGDPNAACALMGRKESSHE